MTASLFIPPRTVAVSSNSRVVPGAQRYFYLAGTTTPATVYTSSDMTATRTQPVTATSGGEFPACYVDVPVKVSEYTANGVLRWTEDNIPSGSYISQADVAAALYPQTVAELSAEVTPTNYVYPEFDIRRYGADPTGTDASDSALTDAVAICGITGGTIRFPRGTYSFDFSINLNQKRNITLEGDGGATNGSAPATAIVYTGTASPFINMTSAFGCELRALQVKFTNPSFVGSLIKCGNDGSNGDAFMNSVKDCSFGNDIADFCVHLDLDKTILFTAERCHFWGGTASVLGQSEAGGSYSNVVSFRDCQWEGCNNTPIRYAGESWTFDSCTFEPLKTGVGNAFLAVAAAPVIGLTFRDCWFGDVTENGGTWITVYGDAVNITGNRFGGDSASAAIALYSVTGANIVGNNFDTFATALEFADANSSGVVFAGNNFSTVTAAIGTPSNAPGNMICHANAGLVTKKCGVTSSIASAATVAHGLSITPTVVLVTALTSGPTNIYITEIGGTTFKINYGGGGSHVFAWEAKTTYSA
jgi:hypothetical protein